jgi:hypothetical protein
MPAEHQRQVEHGDGRACPEKDDRGPCAEALALASGGLGSRPGHRRRALAGHQPDLYVMPRHRYRAPDFFAAFFLGAAAAQ